MTTPPNLSPDAQLQYDELAYVLRHSLADCDADDAIDTLDALLAAHRTQVLTEAAEIASTVIGPQWHLDTLAEITARLDAASGAR